MNKRGSSRELQDTIVIVPAYNEGKVVRGNLEKILAIFPRVVCVNDGSVDDTLECARQSGAIVIDHPINIGQGGGDTDWNRLWVAGGLSIFCDN